jgi:hypothetical protein
MISKIYLWWLNALVLFTGCLLICDCLQYTRWAVIQMCEVSYISWWTHTCNLLSSKDAMKSNLNTDLFFWACGFSVAHCYFFLVGLVQWQWHRSREAVENNVICTYKQVRRISCVGKITKCFLFANASPFSPFFRIVCLAFGYAEYLPCDM